MKELCQIFAHLDLFLGRIIVVIVYLFIYLFIVFIFRKCIILAKHVEYLEYVKYMEHFEMAGLVRVKCLEVF